MHLNNFEGCAGLLLYDFVCHKSNDLRNHLVQPCDVGIIKPLKERLKKYASEWRSECHDALLPGQKIPSPKRKEILE